MVLKSVSPVVIGIEVLEESEGGSEAYQEQLLLERNLIGDLGLTSL